MGTRTYSRRGVDGTRVLTRLGRERQSAQQNTARDSVQIQRDIGLRNAEALADIIRRRGLNVRSVIPSGVIIDRLRALTDDELAALNTVPPSTTRISPYGGIIYDVYTEPTRSVVKDFMQFEGMSFDDAYAKVAQDLAESSRMYEESQRINDTVNPIIDRIKSVTTMQAMNERTAPLQRLMNNVSVQVANNPQLNVEQAIRTGLRQLPEFQSLSSTQVQRMVRATQDLAAYRTNSVPVPSASAQGYPDESAYAQHKDILNRARSVLQPYMIPWTEFVADLYGVL